METTAASAMTIAAWPGCAPRLLHDQPNLQTVREDYTTYSERGGYRPLASADELLDDVERSGLLGRGGAAFPLAVKLRAVRDNGVSSNVGTVVVANGEEGEPASVKDRWLLREPAAPGPRRAAAGGGGPWLPTGHMSTSPTCRRHTASQSALSELGADTLGGIDVAVRMVDPAYIAGRGDRGGPGAQRRPCQTDG